MVGGEMGKRGGGEGGRGEQGRTGWGTFSGKSWTSLIETTMPTSTRNLGSLYGWGYGFGSLYGWGYGFGSLYGWGYGYG